MYDALTLNFVNPRMEHEFRTEYFKDSLCHLRLGLLLGLILYALFGVLDCHVIPDATNQAWLIRYGIICPIIAGVLLFSYSSNFPKYREAVVASMGISAGIGIVAMIAIAKPPGSHLYYAGLLLCSIFYFTFLRMRYITATCVGWLVFALYEVATLALTDIPAAYFINNTVFLLAFNITGMSTCYALEKSRRAAFLQHRLMEKQNEKLHLALAEVEERRREAEDISRRDPLTNMSNRRYFLTLGAFECTKHQRHGQDFCVLLIEIDNLRLLHDSSGIDILEQVIQVVAREVGGFVRQSDIACRFSDDLFAILLPGTHIEEGLTLAKRLRRQIEKSTITTDRGPISTTVSIGIAGTPTESSKELDMDLLIGHASQALHLAKISGRNRVKTWSPEKLRSAS